MAPTPHRSYLHSAPAFGSPQALQKLSMHHECLMRLRQKTSYFLWEQSAGGQQAEFCFRLCPKGHKCPLLQKIYRGLASIGSHQKRQVDSDDSPNFLQTLSIQALIMSFDGQLQWGDHLYRSNDGIKKRQHLFFRRPRFLVEELGNFSSFPGWKRFFRLCLSSFHASEVTLTWLIIGQVQIFCPRVSAWEYSQLGNLRRQSEGFWERIYFSMAYMVSYQLFRPYFSVDPRLRKMTNTLNQGSSIIPSESLSEGGLLQFWKHQNIQIQLIAHSKLQISKQDRHCIYKKNQFFNLFLLILKLSPQTY